jgi:hypothetical protein
LSVTTSSYRNIRSKKNCQILRVTLCSKQCEFRTSVSNTSKSKVKMGRRNRGKTVIQGAKKSRTTSKAANKISKETTVVAHESPRRSGRSRKSTGAQTARQINNMAQEVSKAQKKCREVKVALEHYVENQSDESLKSIKQKMMMLFGKEVDQNECGKHAWHGNFMPILAYMSIFERTRKVEESEVETIEWTYNGTVHRNLSGGLKDLYLIACCYSDFGVKAMRWLPNHKPAQLPARDVWTNANEGVMVGFSATRNWDEVAQHLQRLVQHDRMVLGLKKLLPKKEPWKSWNSFTQCFAEHNKAKKIKVSFIHGLMRKYEPGVTDAALERIQKILEDPKVSQNKFVPSSEDEDTDFKYGISVPDPASEINGSENDEEEDEDGTESKKTEDIEDDVASKDKDTSTTDVPIDQESNKSTESDENPANDQEPKRADHEVTKAGAEKVATKVGDANKTREKANNGEKEAASEDGNNTKEGASKAAADLPVKMAKDNNPKKKRKASTNEYDTESVKPKRRAKKNISEDGNSTKEGASKAAADLPVKMAKDNNPKRKHEWSYILEGGPRRLKENHPKLGNSNFKKDYYYICRCDSCKRGSPMLANCGTLSKDTFSMVSRSMEHASGKDKAYKYGVHLDEDGFINFESPLPTFGDKQLKKLKSAARVHIIKMNNLDREHQMPMCVLVRDEKKTDRFWEGVREKGKQTTQELKPATSRVDPFLTHHLPKEAGSDELFYPSVKKKRVELLPFVKRAILTETEMESSKSTQVCLERVKSYLKFPSFEPGGLTQVPMSLAQELNKVLATKKNMEDCFKGIRFVDGTPDPHDYIQKIPCDSWKAGTALISLLREAHQSWQILAKAIDEAIDDQIMDVRNNRDTRDSIQPYRHYVVDKGNLCCELLEKHAENMNDPHAFRQYAKVYKTDEGIEVLDYRFYPPADKLLRMLMMAGGPSKYGFDLYEFSD